LPATRILVTGSPGVGKTTLVRRVLELLPDVRAAGFYTKEVRAWSGRTGFRVIALDGRAGWLATAGAEGGPRIGRYAVHVADFEAVALPAIQLRSDADLLVLDEIGKMECLSPPFVAAARRALAADVALLGTVALAGGGFIAEAKRAPGVELIELSRANRDAMPGVIAARLGATGGRPDA
jgi:nucleoside-triphosphatase